MWKASLLLAAVVPTSTMPGGRAAGAAQGTQGGTGAAVRAARARAHRLRADLWGRRPRADVSRRAAQASTRRRTAAAPGLRRRRAAVPCSARWVTTVRLARRGARPSHSRRRSRTFGSCGASGAGPNTACCARQHNPYCVFVGAAQAGDEPTQRLTCARKGRMRATVRPSRSTRSRRWTCGPRALPGRAKSVQKPKFHGAFASTSTPSARCLLDGCRYPFPTHWLISPQADIWIARHVPLRAFLEAAGAADVALPAPCYRQLSRRRRRARAVDAVGGRLPGRGSACAAAEGPAVAVAPRPPGGGARRCRRGWGLCHDEQCVVDGALTKNECRASPGAASPRPRRRAATARRGRRTAGPWPATRSRAPVVDAGDVYTVRRPTFVEGRVAYLPVGSGRSSAARGAAPPRQVRPRRTATRRARAPRCRRGRAEGRLGHGCAFFEKKVHPHQKQDDGKRGGGGRKLPPTMVQRPLWHNISMTARSLASCWRPRWRAWYLFCLQLTSSLLRGRDELFWRWTSLRACVCSDLAESSRTWRCGSRFTPRREPRNFYHRRRTSPPPIRSGTRVAGVCPRLWVLEDVCDPPESGRARDAHGLAFLCIRAYIRPHFVSRA